MANRERIQKFVDGLRFGGYRQYYGGLGRRDPSGDRFCALGVACEVARANDLDVGVEWSSKVDGTVGYYDPANPGTRTWDALPGLVADWYGVAENNMPVGVTRDELLALNPAILFSSDFVDGRTDLVSLNDGVRLTFAQIADLVERTYLKEDDPV